ncbi:hypothetical protein [Mesorhizobium sp. 131-2-1]|uniref:hypothetical protein n=1 Tax=Mesorhizobium sp. 131-2-1 TaxID=2744518 RepID=UPI0019284BFC|nr:hypothetical protein [Mesorhizobium sp. 131-2-1]BCG93516.1 hypothetical protein MesoLj131a_23800 [Mesorhizobium sp. 131-2-1]
MTTSEDVAEMNRPSVLHTITYLKDYVSGVNEPPVMQTDKGVHIQEVSGRVFCPVMKESEIDETTSIARAAVDDIAQRSNTEGAEQSGQNRNGTDRRSSAWLPF